MFGFTIRLRFEAENVSPSYLRLCAARYLFKTHLEILEARMFYPFVQSGLRTHCQDGLVR